MSSSSHRPPPSPAGTDPPAAGPADLAEARALYTQLDPAWFDEANDPHGWLFEPDVQRLIAEVVDAEVAPYAALLAPEEVRALRQEVELACHTDPVWIEYLKRIRPRAPQDASGKVRKGMFDRPPGGVRRSPGKAGGRRS